MIGPGAPLGTTKPGVLVPPLGILNSGIAAAIQDGSLEFTIGIFEALCFTTELKSTLCYDVVTQKTVCFEAEISGTLDADIGIFEAMEVIT